MVPELHAKVFEEMTKIWLYEKRYNFETKQTFRFKNWYEKFKIGLRIVLKFQVGTFWTDGGITRKNRYGRAGLGRFITDIDFMVENKLFLFYKSYRTSQQVSRYDVVRKSLMTVERSSRLKLPHNKLKSTLFYSPL